MARKSTFVVSEQDVVTDKGIPADMMVVGPRSGRVTTRVVVKGINNQQIAKPTMDDPRFGVFADRAQAIMEMRNMTRHHKNDLWAELMIKVADSLERGTI